MGRPTLPRRGPWGPLLLPSRGPRAPYFYPEGAHGAPYGRFSSRKKFFAALLRKFFPLHGRIRGPMGPPTFTQPGTQGPLLLPRRGPWGPLWLVSLPEKNFRGSAAKIFFRFTVEFGGPWGPYFYPAGDPGPPTFTQKGPMGPPTVGFPTKKKFRRACAPDFFLSKSFYIYIYIYIYIRHRASAREE